MSRGVHIVDIVYEQSAPLQQRIPHFEAGRRHEVVIVRPDFLRAVLEREDGYLQIKYPLAADL